MAELVAKTEFEKAIKDYLDNNIPSSLLEKIKKGEKTLEKCCNYIMSEMKKRAVGGCAVATDQEVFGLAVHFFEEDELKGDEKPMMNTRVVRQESKPEPKAEPKRVEKKPEAKLEGQMNIFDFLGA